MSTSNVFTLDPICDISAAEGLLEKMRAYAEHASAVCVDGSQVERFTTPAAQILLSVKKHCDDTGKAFTLQSASQAMTHALATLGLDSQFIHEDVA